MPYSDINSYSSKEYSSLRMEPSGQIMDTFTHIGEHFSQHTEIPTEGHNCLFKAKRYGKWYILKGLKPPFRNDSAHKLMLAKEFEIGMMLHHPNFVQIIGKENDRLIGPCIVMEYVDGRNLNDFIQEGHKNKHIRKIMVQILHGLDYLHGKHIVHRDLKPENILITHQSNLVKIIDFGLSDTNNFDYYKNLQGDNVFIAPEILNSDYIVDHRSDLYSFGRILKYTRKRHTYISYKCTRKNPNERFYCAKDIIYFIRLKTIIKISLLLILLIELLVIANVLLVTSFH